MEIKRYNQFVNEELKTNTYTSAALKLDKRGFKERAKRLREWAYKFRGDDSYVFNLYFEINSKREKVTRRNFGSIDRIEKGYFDYFDLNYDMFFDTYDDTLGNESKYYIIFSVGFNLINPNKDIRQYYDVGDYGNSFNAFNIGVELVMKDGELIVSGKYTIEEGWTSGDTLALPSNRKDAIELKKRISDKFVPGDKGFDELFDFMFEKGIMHKDELMKVNNVIKSININDLWFHSPEAERKLAEEEKVSPVDTTDNIKPIYKYKE